MPEEAEEIPDESGNIYKNLEPTISFMPIRKKLKQLNKEAMKNLDMKNRATYHAQQGSTAMKEQAVLNDARMDNSCTICIAAFQNKQKLRLTPCGHAFHADCMGPWLLSGKNHCPSCKLEMLHTSKDESCSV
jgi:E3 ubiquitin-protein ligase RNF13